MKPRNSFEQHKQHVFEILKQHQDNDGWIDEEGRNRLKLAREALKIVGYKVSPNVYENTVLAILVSQYRKKGRI